MHLPMHTSRQQHFQGRWRGGLAGKEQVGTGGDLLQLIAEKNANSRKSIGRDVHLEIHTFKERNSGRPPSDREWHDTEPQILPPP